jgi:hypothetical protein
MENRKEKRLFEQDAVLINEFLCVDGRVIWFKKIRNASASISA